MKIVYDFLNEKDKRYFDLTTNENDFKFSSFIMVSFIKKEPHSENSKAGTNVAPTRGE